MPKTIYCPFYRGHDARRIRCEMAGLNYPDDVFGEKITLEKT